MKQKMKHLVSVIALVAMLVSMFSVCVFPAVAADEYSTLLNEALVVNPAWEGYGLGDAVSFTFRGKTYTENFDTTAHFATFSDAWAQAKKMGKTNPVILLCAGDYTETIAVDSGVTLLGPNAGVDPNVKSAAKNQPWTLTSDRPAEGEARIRSDIYIKKAAGDGNITIDGLRFDEPIYTVENKFGVGGSIVDYERTTGSSELTVKNSVFVYAGNTEEARGYTMYLRSQGHTRKLTLQNLYITGENKNAASKTPVPGFISPYFTELYADNIAYVENKNGFLASTYFWLGVSPIVEITNSCFFNNQYNKAEGYVISMDNLSFGYDYNGGADRLFTTTGDVDVSAYSGDKRPAASLLLRDNVFYNASGKSGVIHYEFTNARSVVDIQNNYVYKDDNNGNTGGTLIDTEFVSNSASVDQTSCIVIKNNQLIGAYKIPSLYGASSSTAINMSDNYFGNTLGQCVPQPVYMNQSATKLIRPTFWVDEEMTVNQLDWFLNIGNWDLATVYDADYTASMILYTESDLDVAPVTYSSSEGFQVQLYKNAEVSSDGVVLNVSEWSAIPDNKLTSAYLNPDPYGSSKIYAKIVNPEYPDFTPVYTITVENMGSIAGVPTFESVFPEGYSIYKTATAGMNPGALVPVIWKGETYLCEYGKNVFESVDAAITAANNAGILEPTIMIPSGNYTEELVITGSCIILGEQHGVNPNHKPVAYEDLTRNGYQNSGWTLNPSRDQSRETTFHACIRVDEKADNYRITLDGIKMVDGCSYVDDYSRTGETVTIFKNVYAENAGGGKNRTGGVNGQVFNFNKPFSSNSTDRCEMYMYDCRLDNFSGRTAFGPFFEKYVLDGTFFGNAVNKTVFWSGIRSRDVANPYYALTNCCIWNNAGSGQSGFYFISTGDHNGNLAKKTNIIYNFNANMFYNPTTTGYGGMEIIFTGNNMTFYMTNNTWVHLTNSGVFFASTVGSSRFRGDCPSQDVSDMIVCTGNRFVGMRTLPTTGGTGNGTMFDFSGNYFANNLSGTTGLDAKNAWKQEVSPSSSLGNYTYEQCSRVKVDYTFLDWELTIRSDGVGSSSTTSSDYTVTTGLTGYGRMVNGVYRETVPADAIAYPNPVVPVSDKAAVRILDSNKNEIPAMTLTAQTNTFYVEVTAGGTKSEVMVVVEREPGEGSELIALENFYIDSKNKTVSAYTPLEEWQKFRIENIIVSPGATYALYETEDCTTPVSSVSIKATAYIKVVGEDNSETVYTINFKAADSTATVSETGLAYVETMQRVDELSFEATIAAASSSFSFTPVPVFGSSLKVVIDGNEVLPGVDGSYTVRTSGSGTQPVTVVTTSGDGLTSKSYTLYIKKGLGTEAELLSMVYYAGIGNIKEPSVAVMTSGGYVMDLGHAYTVTVKPEVSVGAITKVYTDSSCAAQYLVADNRVDLVKDGEMLDTMKVWVVVESEDGSARTPAYEVTLRSKAKDRIATEIVGTTGNKDYTATMNGKTFYTLELPAKADKVVLSSSLVVPNAVNGRVDGGTISFFADPNRTVPIVTDANGKTTIALTQKVTTVYTSVLAGSFSIVASDDSVLNVKIHPWNGILTIYSDRDVATYKDAASFKNHWVKPYVDSLNNGGYGIFYGDNNKNLNIQAKITRYEVAAIASRVLGLDVNHFTEGYAAVGYYADSIVEWAAPYVRAVSKVGIMNGHLEGDKLYFKGNDYATREQVIKVLVNAVVLSKGNTATMDASGSQLVADAAVTYYNDHKTTVDLAFATYKFQDTAKVSPWAVPYIRLAVAEFNMIGGSNEGGKLYLNPHTPITRAEVIKIVSAYYSAQ